MRIQTIVSQNRRDFTAIFRCDNCGHEEKRQGYDDWNFHNKVVPAMTCPVCEQTEGSNYRPLATKYPDSQVV